MPFASDFWTTSWVNIKHPHDFPGSSYANPNTTSSWRQLTISTTGICDVIQGPYNAYDGDNLDSFNIGTFQGERDSGATVMPLQSVEPTARSFIMAPNPTIVNLISDDVDEHRWVTFYAPFYRHSSGQQFQAWTRGTGSGTQQAWYLHHVQPIAFRGVVSEVIGAILMYAGYDAARIDQDSFDDAYDTELLIGPDNDERPYVWVIPQQGETVLATIKRIMQHWNHILTFDRAGKLALVPADSQTTHYVFHDVDSNILELKNQVDRSLIYNTATVMHASGMMRHAGYVGPTQPNPVARCHYEPHLKSDFQQAYIDDYSDTASIAKYGERRYGSRVKQTVTEGTEVVTDMTYGPRIGFDWFHHGAGRERIYTDRTVDTISEGDPIKIAHFPLCYRDTIKDLIMERFISNDAQLKEIVEVKQDLLGFDFDIGSMVLNAVNGLTYRCVKQTIDFNKFTVTSSLIQEFGTQYSTAENVIWDTVNLDDAPIGTTSLGNLTGDSYLEINILVTPTDLDWRFRIYASKDHGPWEELTSGWTSKTGNFYEWYRWSPLNDEVRLFIRAADDNGSGGEEMVTPFIAMPTAYLP